MDEDIIDHVEIPVADAAKSLEFYKAALAPLGLSLVISIDPSRTSHIGARHGFGNEGYPRLWVHEQRGATLPMHVAFAGAERQVVDAFYSAALTNGG